MTETCRSASTASRSKTVRFFHAVLDPKTTFDGKKNIVLSTASKFGGRKMLPGIFCIGLSVVMLLVGGFLLYLWINPVKSHKEQPLLIDDGY